MKQENQPNTVIFDLGAVLIDWNPRYLYSKMFDNDAEMEAFLKNVCHSAWNLSLDAGKSFDEAVAERIEAFPEHELAIQAYKDRWIEMIGGPIQQTVDLFNQLVELKTPLYALTNWSAETFKLVRHDQAYSFLNAFREIIVSGEIGMIKPNADIFHHALKVVGEPAENCLFVDDNPANCTSARALGFHVHEFSKAPGLEADLKRLSFLKP